MYPRVAKTPRLTPRHPREFPSLAVLYLPRPANAKIQATEEAM